MPVQDGRTALHIACQHRKEGTATMLVSAGANPYEPDDVSVDCCVCDGVCVTTPWFQQGYTPLDYCAAVPKLCTRLEKEYEPHANSALNYVLK